MDTSNQGMNGSYMQYNNGTNFDPSQFYNDMQNFTTGNNDAQPQYDPALFDMPDLSSFPQPSQQQQQQPPQPPTQQSQSAYGQSVPQRHSQSPAVPQYKAAPQPAFNHQQYGHGLYDQRNVSQPSFDPHIMSRPTPSPGPYDRYPFQQPMNFGTQNFDPRFVHYQPPRQSSTPTQFQQQQPPPAQSTHQYMNIAARPPSQPSHFQINPDLYNQRPDSQRPQPMQGMQYNFQQNQPGSHRFIDPSMLNANGGGVQASTAEAQTHQMQSPTYYAKGGSTVDPRALQQQQQQLQIQNQQQTSQAGILTADGNFSSAIPQAQYMQLHFEPQNVGQVKPDTESVTTKKPKAKSKKEGVTPGTPRSTASSDDDLEIAQNEPEPRPELLRNPKPLEHREKLIYEVVDAVWSDRNNIAPPEKIRTGIAAFGEAVRGLRDGWKAQNEQLKKAEIPNSPSAASASALKMDVERHREIMRTVTANAVTLGHPAILKRLGDNQFTMSALYSFLLDRVNADDYNSELVKIILMLATKFETVDEEQLERVKWTKILTRFTKKSTNQSKDYAQKILLNAKAASAKKGARKGADGPQSPSTTSAGVKRSREGEGANLPATKKAIVKPASKPLSVQIAERRKLLEKENAAKAAKAEKPALNGSQNATAVRPKTAAVPPAKVISLTSASKKPGTSNAERAAAGVKDKNETAKPATTSASAAAVKRETSTTDSPPLSKTTPATSSASSFLGYLADMEKPKEAQVKKVEEIPNETPEQREKRLRKESRRRLRVSWKPDSELVETKIFEHDPEEETGHEDSMMKDAGDTVREGEMLKRHFDKDEMDDSDEEEEQEEDFYSPPSEVDFEVIDAESRNGNYIKCGGPMKPESPSSAAQAEHEEGNLMTMYTPSEQPDTPKELPSASEDDDFQPFIDFGEPEEKVRKREQAVIARKQPYDVPQPQPSSSLDLSALLGNIQQKQQPVSSQQPAFDLQQTLGIFNQGQASSAPQQSVLAGIDLQKLLAVSQQFTSLQQGQQYNQYQAPQQPQAPVQNVTPNLQAILAQMQGAQQSQGLSVGSNSNPNPFPGHDDQSKKKQRGKAPVGPDGRPLNYKTQVCSFWKEGKCLKGDACTYRHDE